MAPHERPGRGDAGPLGGGDHRQNPRVRGEAKLAEGRPATLVGDAHQGRRGEGERRVVRPEELGEARRGGRGERGDDRRLVHWALGRFAVVSLAGGGGAGSRCSPSARPVTRTRSILSPRRAMVMTWPRE